ncbi:MAG: hypothetical protein J6Y37_14425, partial [Paludibacteraceae bacterium]|nr:hypothetical protein [Paludibacteraceae bacterium]
DYITDDVMSFIHLRFVLRKALYYLNTAVILPIWLIGMFFYGLCIVCDWVMRKLDYRLRVLGEE